MLKINLEKKLIALREEDGYTEKEKTVLAEADRILESYNEDDMEILKSLG